MSFTAVELAELARADMEIEASFRLTEAEWQLSGEIDKSAAYEKLDRAGREAAEYQRAYREAHKAEVAERQRAYYEAHKAEVAERQRAYREAHRAEAAERQRAYYEAHKAEAAEYQRAYREAHKAEAAEYKRAISRARKARGLTQKQLAELLGVSQPAVAQWETGTSPANLDLLRKVFSELDGQ